jgi:SAM-dependent methyltransferase
MKKTRAFFSNYFCRGHGIEIGALHNPMPIHDEAKVRYVDRLPVEKLRTHYPELSNLPLVRVDIVDEGETLGTLPDGLEDFVIASQFLEHCQNPVRAMVNMLRVVKNHGYIMLTIPDKRFTFDKDRPLTTNEHILDECLNGTERNKRDHYREYSRFTSDFTPGEALENRVDDLIEKNWSIHFHVWDSESFIQFLLFFKERFKLPFEIEATFRNHEELIVILKKALD